MDNKIEVKGSIVHNIHVSHPGGCIDISENTKRVLIYQCYFNNCSSSGLKGSSVRSSSLCSGGTIFADANEITMNSCVFIKCSGRGLGSVVYICGTKNYKTKINCLCDVECVTSNDHSTISIYAIERSRSEMNNINSTNSITKNSYGCIHIGWAPESFICDYVAIIYDENDKNHVCLGLASKKSELSHVFIQNCENQNGILMLWSGDYIFNEAYFYCSGGMLYSIANGQVSITFYNSKFCSDITLGTIITDQNCVIIDGSETMKRSILFASQTKECTYSKNSTYKNFIMFITLICVYKTLL